MNLNRIELSVLKVNEVAIRLYKRHGFKKEGLKVQAVYKEGIYMDMFLMALSRSDYLIDE